MRERAKQWDAGAVKVQANYRRHVVYHKEHLLESQLFAHSRVRFAHQEGKHSPSMDECKLKGLQ